MAALPEGRRPGPKPRSLEARFWPKVVVTDDDGCWLWQGGLQDGYGAVRLSGRGSATVHAHRVAWELTYGPIPEGIAVLHSCDTPRCCRPTHLFLGTPVENVADMVAKGRQARGSRVHLARLTEGAVRDMRQRSSSGETQRALAREFRVSQSTVGRILRGECWGWLT